jgi:hypothetical protein
MPEVPGAPAPTRTLTFFEGDWHEGNIAIMGPRTHGAWLGSSVFDGARAFEGVAPDLDLHFKRINDSARKFLLKPVVSVETWLGLAVDGIGRFGTNAELYIRPMYWAESGGPGGGVRFDPESTRWCLCLYEAPMPKPTGSSITLSPYRRPTLESAPVDTKAGCADRGPCARFPQLPHARHARQYRGTWERQCLHGQGRNRLHARPERDLPRRHYATTRDRAAA